MPRRQAPAGAEAPRVRPSLAWPPWAVSIVVAIGFFLAACLGLALLEKANAELTTALRRSEQRLRLMQESAGLAHFEAESNRISQV